MEDVSDGGRRMSWGVARRFEFLEWRAFWNGRVNRSDLEAYFNVSTPQASADMKLYQEKAPDNIAYDATAKAFLPLPSFSPKYLRVSADRYLLQIASVQNGAIQVSDTMFGSLPPAAVVPSVIRSVNPHVLRAILHAIRHQQDVEVEYLSLTSSRKRWIGPHSLAFDGHRWHLRAWCPDHSDFRDYVLTRILSVGETRKTDGNPSDDAEWNNLVRLKIVAHPELKEEQRRTIEHDYGMEDGFLDIEARIALAFYLEKRMCLDVDADCLPPSRKQLKLVNREQILEARADALEETRKRVTLRRETSSL